MPMSPIGRDVRIVTRLAGNSVIDIKGMKTKAAMMMRKTVAVAFIV